MSTSEPVAADSTATSRAIHPQRHPCLLCQQRKVKCDRNMPCSNCVKARVECVAPRADLPHRRKRRFPEAELLARLRRYEAYFKENGIDPEAVGHSAKSPRSEGHFAEAITSYSRQIISSPTSSKSLKNGNLLSDQFCETEEILEGSSDGDAFETPMTKSFDLRQASADGYDLVFEGQESKDLADLHPSPVHIFRLWQIFLDNVNPLVKILHAPTVQQQILDASADVSQIPMNTEALMFGIYSMAIVSIDNEKCNDFFGKEREFLLGRYHVGARKALTNARLLGSSDLITLQAFSLYLLSNFQGASCPRSLFCLTGIAMRIAQRMGLNRDGTNLGLPPFEAEMRRRLWWQLLMIDHRVSEVSGSPNPHASYSWSTNPPSNVNDNDLFPEMRDKPVESDRPTEMLFVSLRCKIFEFTRKFRQMLGSPTNANDKEIDALETHLESKHLKHCDPSAPIHLLSILMVRLNTWALRTRPGRRRQMTQKDHDLLFSASLRVLECHNAMLATESIQKFIWYAFTNPPFAAYLHLLCALRTRTEGELADRSWDLLSEYADNREKHNSWDHPQKSGPLRLALANLIIKAWEARETARSHFQPVLPVPRFISVLRERLASRRPRIQDADPPGACVVFVPGGIPDLHSGMDIFSLPNVSPSEWPTWDDFMQGDVMSHIGDTRYFG